MAFILPTFGVVQTNKIFSDWINRTGVDHLTSLWYVLLAGYGEGFFDAQQLSVDVFSRRQGCLEFDIGVDTPL